MSGTIRDGLDTLVAEDMEAYLDAHEHKDMLRFLTCGSVDDGKSTLIGRLLYESHLVFEDHLAALEADSRKIGTQGGELDFALLVDGLSAEREQGITIDVAYRFFSTQRRKFIVADTPGHEQYTRNMVTGASNSDAAVVMIDARKGVLTQTRRHSFLVGLLGIEHVVVAVNKLDIVGYDQGVYDHIVETYRALATEVGLDDVTCIPVSALKGDNIIEPSANTPWYRGPTLLEHLEHLEHLESIDIADRADCGPFRMPVQWVNRPNLDFRGFSGVIVGGEVRVGDAVRAQPSGLASTVEQISAFDGTLDVAVTGQSVTLVLADEIDVSRGDVLCSDDRPAETAGQFEAHIVWMHDEALLPGRPYLLKLGTTTVNATLSPPKHVVDINTLGHLAAKTLSLNEIGVCTITTDRPVSFDPYEVNRDMGGFILIDRMTNATVGAGMLQFALRRSQNVRWQEVDVTPEARSSIKGHGPAVVWFTGLSGAGKSTIANRTEQLLHAAGVHTFMLDGDNVRHGLNHDLGFTDADRVENIRRTAEVARLMADAGIVVLVSFISPFRAERDLARDLAGEGRFVEVFVDTPLAEAEARDSKGLYDKARRGELANFTGIDSPYEVPTNPDIHIDTLSTSPQEGCRHGADQTASYGNRLMSISPPIRHWVTYPLVTHPYDPAFTTKDALTRFARTAEDAGFEGIGFTDHPAPSHRWLQAGGHDALDPFVALAFMAAVTDRLLLIPNILVLPYRNPFLVAKAAATVDAVSDGRFVLSTAVGYLRAEYNALGVDFDERNALFDEALHVIKGIWTTDNLAFDGRHFRASGQTANPKPARIPIWIGGNSKLARQRVADHGDAWNPFPAPPSLSTTAKTPTLESTEDLARMLDDLWQRVEAAGRDRTGIDVGFSNLDGGRPGSAGFDPDRHIEGLSELSSLGVTWNSVSVPGDSFNHALETLHEYGEKVIRA